MNLTPTMFVILALFHSAPASAAELRVIVMQGIEQAYREWVKKGCEFPDFFSRKRR